MDGWQAQVGCAVAVEARCRRELEWERWDVAGRSSGIWKGEGGGEAGVEASARERSARSVKRRGGVERRDIFLRLKEND